MKKKYLKFLVTFAIILTLILSTGCTSKFDLSNFVTELRSDIFEGQGEIYSLRCAYGFTLHNGIDERSSDHKVYGLTFKLVDRELDTATTTVSFTYNGETLKNTFALNPVTHSMVAFIEVEQGFNLKEFEVTVSSSSNSDKIMLKSIVPTQSLTYKKALDCLNKNQPDLINNYKNDSGGFMATLCARIIVKDGKTFWYIGIKESKVSVKALLIDGTTGEVLAIREVL